MLRPSIIAVLLIKIWIIILLRPGWIAVPAFLVLRRSLAFCCFRFRLRQASGSQVYPADTPVMRIIYCPRKHFRIEIFDNLRFNDFECVFYKTGTKPVTLKFWIGKVNGVGQCCLFTTCHIQKLRYNKIAVSNLCWEEMD